MPRPMRKVMDRRPRRLGCATHAAMAPTRRGPQVEPKPRCDYQTFLCNHSICGRPVSSLTVGCDTHSRAHAHADTHTHSHTRIPPYTRRPMSPGGRAGGACDSDICCLRSTTTGDGLAASTSNSRLHSRQRAQPRQEALPCFPTHQQGPNSVRAVRSIMRLTQYPRARPVLPQLLFRRTPQL